MERGQRALGGQIWVPPGLLFGKAGGIGISGAILLSCAMCTITDPLSTCVASGSLCLLYEAWRFRVLLWNHRTFFCSSRILLCLSFLIWQESLLFERIEKTTSLQHFMLIKGNLSDKGLRVVFKIPNYCCKRQSCVRGNQRSERTKPNISFIHHKNKLHLKYLEMEVF